MSFTMATGRMAQELSSMNDCFVLAQTLTVLKPIQPHGTKCLNWFSPQEVTTVVSCTLDLSMDISISAQATEAEQGLAKLAARVVAMIMEQSGMARTCKPCWVSCCELKSMASSPITFQKAILSSQTRMHWTKSGLMDSGTHGAGVSID